MEQLLHQQTELQGRISRSYENLRKLGSANITKGAIQMRLDGLIENWQKFEAHHEQLLAYLTKETATYDYFAKNIFGITEEIFYTQKTRFVDLMAQYMSSEGEKTAPSTVIPEQCPKSRLVHIELPHFSGSFQTWAQFKDIFTSLVISDQNLTNTERIHYLLNVLSGKPANLLKGIPVIGENFLGAWEQLTTRYDNKRLLVDSQFNAVAAIKPMSTNSAQELKRVFHGTLNVVNSLEALGRSIKQGTDWLVHTTVERLSNDTLQHWETSLGGSKEPPSFDHLKQILETQTRTLETVEAKTQRPQPKATPKHTSQSTQRNVRSHQVTKKDSARVRCLLCQGNHFILYCEALQSKTPSERKDIIIARELCLNCLGKHKVSECTSEKRCQKCLGRHHSILHKTVHSQPIQRTTHVAELNISRDKSVILATAQVYITTHRGEKILVRALIDQGSEVTLVTENLAQLLQLPRRKVDMIVTGVGTESYQRVRSEINTSLTSRVEPDYCLPVKALVLRRLTNYQPDPDLTQTSWDHIKGLELADPDFNRQGRLDMILGVDVHSDIIQEGLRKGPSNAPISQKTALGWTLSGKITGRRASDATTTRAISLHALDNELVPLIQRFWQQKELTTLPLAPTPEEALCEEHFTSTHRRTDTGRYVVRLPCKNNIPHFKDTRPPAVKVQLSMERRFARSSELANLYREFMQEYADLGHMEESSGSQETGAFNEYFLPHHGVWKESSSTTRLRVVFNGSQLDSKGHALNNFLFTGPNLLPELSNVLLRWRRHRFVISADIEKMYRQILVDPWDQNLQKIVWRTDTSGPLRTFKLKTVTYGLSCAPFLAMRTLRQLADDKEHHYPMGSQALRADCYVDDVLTGDSSLATAKQRQGKLIDICKAGGFNLRK